MYLWRILLFLSRMWLQSLVNMEQKLKYSKYNLQTKFEDLAEHNQAQTQLLPDSFQLVIYQTIPAYFQAVRHRFEEQIIVTGDNKKSSDKTRWL